MKKLLGIAFLLIASSAFAGSPYVGASVGYLTDSKVALYETRVGVDVAKTGAVTHAVEMEIGYTRVTESWVTSELIPLMANYRVTVAIKDTKLNLFCAAGLGMTDFRLKAYGTQSDWAFSYQVLGGVEYQVSPQVSLQLGARYLWVGEASVFGITDDVGDEISIEFGFHFHF
jgi:opacity protein-like surface antigen